MQQADDIKAPPIGTRIRFAAGFRVPVQHRRWALDRIQSEGWPVRQWMVRGLFLYPLVTVVSLLTHAAMGGPWYAVTYQLVIFPVVWVTFGLIAGTAWPDPIRRRATRYHARGVDA